MTTPPSLGDSGKKKFVLTDETWESEGGRDGLFKTLKDIIGGGGVQKIVAEVGKPVLVKRWVDATSTAPGPSELPPDDVFAAARNAEMMELPFVDGHTAFEQLFQAFLMVSHKRLKPSALLVHHDSELRAWLEVGSMIDVTQVFGIETKSNELVPEDTALLVASDSRSEDLVSFSVRIPMNMPLVRKS